MNEKQPECQCPECLKLRRGPWGKEGQDLSSIPMPALTQQERDDADGIIANGAAYLAGTCHYVKHLETAAGVHRAMGSEDAARFFECLLDVVNCLIARECAGLTLDELNLRWKGAVAFSERMAKKNAKGKGANVDNCPGCGKPHKHGEQHDGADYPDSL